MDSRGKQRLTGAIILVALFVLLVPELLTGPRHTATTEAPADDGLRRYTIDLDAPGASVQPMPAPAGQPAVALPPVVENPMSDAQARALPGEAARPVAQPPQALTQVTPQPVAPMAVAPKPVTPAAATPAPRAETQPPAAAGGAFAVQLGSFSIKENADQLVRDMTAKGFNAFLAPTTMSNGHALYRVRVGPTRDRAAAEALAAQLRRIGQTKSSIVSIS